ncbi:hypothetical protein [Streptacidiphilus sp. EB129]|uniref:hypothetical protein n=1 Tax=Streptacidiphilus sp. EB129 TaxID=3156262 RepID=UPI003515BF80
MKIRHVLAPALLAATSVVTLTSAASAAQSPTLPGPQAQGYQTVCNEVETAQPGSGRACTTFTQIGSAVPGVVSQLPVVNG